MSITSNSNAPAEDVLTYDKMMNLIKSMPKCEEFWSWSVLPISGAWCFEDDRAKVTIGHPMVWKKVRSESEYLNVKCPNPLFYIQILDIDGDDPLAIQCRKRFSDHLIKNMPENI